MATRLGKHKLIVDAVNPGTRLQFEQKIHGTDLARPLSTHTFRIPRFGPTNVIALDKHPPPFLVTEAGNCLPCQKIQICPLQNCQKKKHIDHPLRFAFSASIFWSSKNIKFLTILSRIVPSFFLTNATIVLTYFQDVSPTKGRFLGTKVHTHTHTRTNKSKFITCQ